MTQWWQRRFARWLVRRVPPSDSIKLSRQNIFIFPSAAGFAYTGLLVLLWLVATNYENNLILAVVFLLAGIFVVSVLHTFFNLSGLTVKAVKTRPAFVGEDAEIELLIENAGPLAHENLLVSYVDKPPVIVNLIDQQKSTCKVYFTPSRRGRINPGRLLVQTWYPLGLLRAWTWLDLDIQTLVYPKPLSAGAMPTAETSAEEGRPDARALGVDDFFGFRDYQQGDSARQIAWKKLAQGRGVYTKEFATHLDHRRWIDWDYLGGMDREARLSRLCYWVLQAEKGSEDYGLRLPGVERSPSRGAFHRDELLKELALFELSSYEASLSNPT